jgi:hypothetical protein
MVTTMGFHVSDSGVTDKGCSNKANLLGPQKAPLLCRSAFASGDLRRYPKGSTVHFGFVF